MARLLPTELPTPCYLVDEARLTANLEILAGLAARSGCKILLAQKAFSMFACYPLISRYLSGASASGLYEAKLAAEEMSGENHVFSPAFRAEEMPELTRLCDHLVFNSFSQLQRFGPLAAAAGCSVGLRINPQLSTQERPLYDPCAPGSRLGITAADFAAGAGSIPEFALVRGLHFHTLCEQDADALAATLAAVEAGFGPWLPRMEWLNFGGGLLITRDGFDLPLLESCIREARDKWGVQVYLEPGEAVALNAGYLLTQVLEVGYNGLDIAILDASAACHMPDVLEAPYRPPLLEEEADGPCLCRLTGPTCLAGDVIGDYRLAAPPRPGDLLTFGDMAIYTMVKNNTFNGLPLPAIAIRDAKGCCRLVRRFGYDDFKGRLS